MIDVYTRIERQMRDALNHKTMGVEHNALSLQLRSTCCGSCRSIHAAMTVASR